MSPSAIPPTTPLRIGSKVSFVGKVHTVVGIDGSGVRLRDEAGRPQLISTWVLLGSPGFHHLPANAPVGLEEGQAESVNGTTPDEEMPDEDSTPTLPLAALLPDADRDALAQLLPRHAMKQLLRTEAELLGILCPMPGPDATGDLTMSERVEVAAQRLGVSARTVWRNLDNYRNDGLFGLADKRLIPIQNPLAGHDPRVVEAIIDQIKYEEADSTGTRSRFLRRIKDRLEDVYGVGVVPLLSDRSLLRAIDIVDRRRVTFGSAVSRRSRANQTKRRFTYERPTRPGEVVMVDSTPLDVLVYDPLTDTVAKPQLSVMVDLATRSILAWRLVPGGETQAIDALGLMIDAIAPEPMRPAFPEAVAFAHSRVPVRRLIRLDDRLAAAAARPVILPEVLVVDNDKTYIGSAMRRACALLGVNLQFARLKKPLDKPEVERVFGTIRTQFAQHVAGYTGRNVDTRGRDVEKVARWTLAEVEDFFAEYVVCIYQRRQHKSLHLEGEPARPWSPNEEYADLVTLHGYVTTPTKPDLFYELLPIAWRHVDAKGVQISLLHYDSDALNAYRDVKSRYPHKAGKWPVRVDNRNLLYVYVKDHDGVWQPIRWVHAPDNLRPFSFRTLEHVKASLNLFTEAENRLRAADANRIAAELTALQRRMDADEATKPGKLTTRRLTRDREHARRAARDRYRASATADTVGGAGPDGTYLVESLAARPDEDIACPSSPTAPNREPAASDVPARPSRASQHHGSDLRDDAAFRVEPFPAVWGPAARATATSRSTGPEKLTRDDPEDAEDEWESP